jgi:energy-converting hydrogenase Eha subunit F
MTLFGTTIDGQQIMSLVSLLLVLVFWIMILRRQKRSDRTLSERLSQLYPKPDPQPDAKTKSADPSDPPRGPWG